MKNQKLLSIHSAVAAGIERLRRSNWVGRMDHLQILIIDGHLGPWAHFYSPMNGSLKNTEPVDIMILQTDRSEEVWLPYTGPLPGSPEYVAEEKR